VNSNQLRCRVADRWGRLGFGHGQASLADALATGASRVVIDATDVDWASGVAAAHGERVAVGLYVAAGADRFDMFYWGPPQ
jgi:hypothetical protein